MISKEIADKYAKAAENMKLFDDMLTLTPPELFMPHQIEAMVKAIKSRGYEVRKSDGGKE